MPSGNASPPPVGARTSDPGSSVPNYAKPTASTSLRRGQSFRNRIARKNEMPDIVYVEQLTSALYLDKRPDVHRYLLAMERMSILSADPHSSEDLIRQVLAETEAQHDQCA